MDELGDQELIDQYGIKPKHRVLDVGGSAKQHRIIAVDTIVDILPPENTPYVNSTLRAKHFCQLDIVNSPLPFADKEFDFCLCSHTLEDLDNPYLILNEMSRVAKRGFISTPSRGQDSVFSHLNLTDWKTGFRRVPGYAHHQWYFEQINEKMYITPKNYPLLYTPEFSMSNWLGPSEFRFYWENEIKFEFFQDITDFHSLIANYRSFMSRNSRLIRRGLPLIYIDNPYYFVKEFAKYLLKKGHGFSAHT